MTTHPPPPDAPPDQAPGTTSRRGRFARRLARIARELAILALVVLAVRLYQQRDLPSGPAPTLQGRDLAGDSVSLADYAGQPVLVHFWATWCGVCKAEAPNVQALVGDMPVLTVASQSGSAADISAHMRSRGLSFRTLQDTDGRLARRFGVGAFPTSFIIDPAGGIAHAEVGYTTELGLRARMWLAGD